MSKLRAPVTFDVDRNSYVFIEHQDWVDRVVEATKQKMDLVKVQDPQFKSRTREQEFESQYYVINRIIELQPPGRLHLSKLSPTHLRDYHSNNPSLMPEHNLLKVKGMADLEVMNFNHKKLGDQYMEVFASSVKSNKNMQHLLMRDCRLTDVGFKKVFEILGGSYGLTKTLDISENSIKLNGAEEMAEFLLSARSLKKIIMTKMNFTDGLVRCIAPSIITSRIVSIDFSNNKIGDAGAVVLATLLSNQCDLTELDLGWNHIHAEGGIALATALQSNTKLRTLDLSWNAVRNGNDPNMTVAEAFAAMFVANTVLVHLDLSHNNLLAGAGIRYNAIAAALLTPLFPPVLASLFALIPPRVLYAHVDSGV